MEAAAAGESGAADGGATGATGLAGALVDLHAVLEAAGNTVDVVVGFIFCGGTATFDTFGEHLPNGLEEARSHGSGETGGAAARTKPCAKANLIGVNLADASDDMLIHQRIFEFRGAPRESFGQIVECELFREGLGPISRKIGEAVYLMAGSGNKRPKGAGVVEAQLLAIVQRELRGRTVRRRFRRKDAHEAGHTQAEDQSGGAVTVEEQIGGLAATANSSNAAAGDKPG